MFGAVSTWSRTSDYLKLLHRCETTDRIRAVVLDIDCPGGSIANFEYLYRAVRRIKAKKQVVAHIRGVGASGGYLLACAANRIVALETSLIGSIGVVSSRPILQELLDRQGVRMAVTKSGHLKDMWAFYREPTDEEQAKQQAVMDSCYDWFVARVAEARGLSSEEVRSLATGEIFTSAVALKLGLIDEHGDIDRALDIACEATETPRNAMLLRPRGGLFDRAVGSVGLRVAESLQVAIETAFIPAIQIRR
jgi:protease-4